MTRNLKALGLALVAAFALSAVAASAAQAEGSAAALFTANVTANETAKIDGMSDATKDDTFTLSGLPALTCKTVTLKGKALAKGPSFTEVTLEPEYETCHIILPGEITKTVTVTPNGCAFVFNATTTLKPSEFVVDSRIECPKEKAIEIHLYNSATSETETLCTFQVPEQTLGKEITLDNIAGTTDDITATVNISGIKTKRTSGSALTCGPVENTAKYVGEETLQATNEAGTIVNLTVSQ